MPALEEQRHVQDHHRIRLVAADALQAAGGLLAHPRVDEALEHLFFNGVVEDDLAQVPPVDLAVRQQDAPAEVRDDVGVGGGALPGRLPRDSVGIDDPGPGLGQHGGDRRFAACDPACQSGDQHLRVLC